MKHLTTLILAIALFAPVPALAQGCIDFSSLTTDEKADCNRDSIQLQGNAIGNNENAIHSLRGDMDTAYGGIAGAYAAAAHHFQVGANAGLQGSVAMGGFEGSHAFSMALGLPINKRAFVAVQGANGEDGATAYSASITWGF